MGNIIGGRKRAKVMKIDGEVFKLRTPLSVFDVIKDYPGHVLLDSETVKKFGIRAKALEPRHELRPNKIYFLVELPKFPESEPRRMSAKDRLERLMRTRRSTVQIKLRLPRDEVEKVIAESRDEAEAAERIIHLCLHDSDKVC